MKSYIKKALLPQITEPNGTVCQTTLKYTISLQCQLEENGREVDSDE